MVTFLELTAKSWDGMMLMKRGEGKFKIFTKILSEIKIKFKFKGNPAIPKGISHSINYINKDSQSKWTNLLSSENSVLQTNLSKHRTCWRMQPVPDCLINHSASHCNQLPSHCNLWWKHFPDMIIVNVIAISFCILLNKQNGFTTARGGE